MMSKDPVPYDSNSDRNLTFISGLLKRFQLMWMLLWDGRVPFWTKLVMPAAFLYLISPIDFIPDAILGLGQLDDLGVILLGIALFIKLAPPDIVQGYMNKLEYGDDDIDFDDDDVVDTTYSVMDED
jgi:uncharacterized membrane protein YkvA (DUF1232 family)